MTLLILRENWRRNSLGRDFWQGSLWSGRELEKLKQLTHRSFGFHQLNIRFQDKGSDDGKVLQDANPFLNASGGSRNKPLTKHRRKAHRCFESIALYDSVLWYVSVSTEKPNNKRTSTTVLAKVKHICHDLFWKEWKTYSQFPACWNQTRRIARFWEHSNFVLGTFACCCEQSWQSYLEGGAFNGADCISAKNYACFPMHLPFFTAKSPAFTMARFADSEDSTCRVQKSRTFRATRKGMIQSFTVEDMTTDKYFFSSSKLWTKSTTS